MNIKFQAKLLAVWILVLSALVTYIVAQGTGTPNQLRVITDATGALVSSVIAQTLPLSQPTLFSNTRLRTDSTGALVVAAASGGYPAISGNAFDLLRGDGVFSTTYPYGTITASSPWTWTQTWNNAGVTFQGFNITTTNTAAANSSIYFKVANAAGDFGVYKDNTTNANAMAIAVNQGLSAGSQNFAFRSNAGIIGLTTGPAADGTRTFSFRNWLANSNWTIAPTFKAGHDFGVRFSSTMPSCWVAAADTDAACDSGFNRDAAGVVAVTTGTASTYRDLRSRHLLGAGTTPAVTNTSANSCGTTTATIVGSDTAGKVTVGATSGTSCTITFTSAFTNAPACVASNETTAALVRATSTASTVILSGAFVAADVLAYQCIGY